MNFDLYVWSLKGFARFDASGRGDPGEPGNSILTGAKKENFDLAARGSLGMNSGWNHASVVVDQKFVTSEVIDNF